MKTKELSQCALLFSFLVICSKISLPIGIIPISFQTMAVILLGLTLTSTQILFVFTAYLISGLCGLPVFANGGGLAYILQPSFGFLLSFPIAAYVLSCLRQRIPFYGISMFLSSLAALGIIYFIGVLYMGFIFHFVMALEKSIWDLLTLGVLPFILNDVVSIGIACVIAMRLPSLHSSVRKQTN